MRFSSAVLALALSVPVAGHAANTVKAEVFNCDGKEITIYYGARSIFLNGRKMDDASIYRSHEKNEAFINFRSYSETKPVFTHYQLTMSNVLILVYQTYNMNGRKLTSERYVGCEGPKPTNAVMPDSQSVRESEGW